MKIKVKEADYSQAIKKAGRERFVPAKQSFLLKKLVSLISASDLKDTGFSFTTQDMEKLDRKEPALILMNHSSFIDLEIAFRIFSDRRFSIVCTSDGFVGKKFLMKKLGCIPTQKFVPDVQLVRHMLYAAKKLNQSILMYPEASYTFDGTATDLPETLGRFLKVLDIPVIVVTTQGAFHRDPLYNNLQKRKVRVSATVKYLLSREDLKNFSPQEINSILKKEFSFDNFRWQQENHVIVNEPFRADCLNRVLYKCPACKTEGSMDGRGTGIKCCSCGKTWELTEQGFMKAGDGNTEFAHVPDWYRWERSCVKEEIAEERYRLEVPVDICVLTDSESIYRVGEGTLVHDREGFHLTGCGGKLEYNQKPLASYSLYSDYFWYELGDVICIGNMKVLYYCFPKTEKDIVAKTRLATEEMYKLVKEKQFSQD